MDVDKTISPLTNLLKKNNKIINMVLIVLLVAMLFPVDHFLNFNPIKDVENQLTELIKNPFVMAVLTIVIYAVFKTNDYRMFALLMFLVHRLLHNTPGSSAPPRRETPPPKAAPPPPKAKLPPKAKATPPPPKAKATPPPPKAKTPPPSDIPGGL